MISDDLYDILLTEAVFFLTNIPDGGAYLHASPGRRRQRLYGDCAGRHPGRKTIIRFIAKIESESFFISKRWEKYTLFLQKNFPIIRNIAKRLQSTAVKRPIGLQKKSKKRRTWLQKSVSFYDKLGVPDIYTDYARLCALKELAEWYYLNKGECSEYLSLNEKIAELNAINNEIDRKRKKKSDTINNNMGKIIDGYLELLRCGQVDNKEFEGNAEITGINIGYSIFEIKYCAFAGCLNLKKIHIDRDAPPLDYIFQNSSYIRHEAFSDCTSLEQVNLWDNLAKIGDEAFKNCTSLHTIQIEGTLESIGNRAFYNCSSLRQLTIPQNVKSIGDDAFAACTSLEWVVISKDFKNDIPRIFGEDCKAEFSFFNFAINLFRLYHTVKYGG